MRLQPKPLETLKAAQKNQRSVVSNPSSKAPNPLSTTQRCAKSPPSRPPDRLKRDTDTQLPRTPQTFYLHNWKSFVLEKTAKLTFQRSNLSLATPKAQHTAQAWKERWLQKLDLGPTTGKKLQNCHHLLSRRHQHQHCPSPKSRANLVYNKLSRFLFTLKGFQHKIFYSPSKASNTKSIIHPQRLPTQSLLFTLKGFQHKIFYSPSKASNTKSFIHPQKLPTLLLCKTTLNLPSSPP